MHPLFTSPRLLFREFTLEDADLIYDLNSDDEVTKYVHELPTTKEVAKQTLVYTILPQYEQNNFGRWAVQLKDTTEFIGWCGLKYRKDLKLIDLGYRFKRKFWGNGYATEAAQRTIEYAKDPLNLSEICAFAHIDNIASWKVLEKCGMQFTGLATVDNCPAKSYRLLLK
jgi:RimJ/RimL family protein N-acetyltransferase